MTGSVGEVRAVLAAVAEDLVAAVRHAGVARARLAGAVEVLARLSEQHESSLVPAELRRAADELERGLDLTGRGAGAVVDLAARL